MSFQPNSIRTLQSLKNLQQEKQADEDEEDIYSILEKNEKIKMPKIPKEEEKQSSGPEPKTQEEYLAQIMSDEAKNQLPPRTPSDFTFRNTAPKFRPQSTSSTGGSQIDSSQNQEQIEEKEEDDDDDTMDPRNFLNNMYKNDNFLQMKANMQNEIIEHTKQEVENKYLIKDCDSYLTDLQKWKDDRKKQDDKRKDALKQHKADMRKIQHATEKIEDNQKENEETDMDPELKLAQEQYEQSMQQFRNLQQNVPSQGRDAVSNLHNDMVQHQIQNRLDSKKTHLDYVTLKMNQEPIKAKYNQKHADMQKQIDESQAKKEAMYKNFADFEAEIDQFDLDMNDIVHNEEKPKSTPSPSSSDNDNFNEIDKMLAQIKMKGEQMQKDESKKQVEISDMMKDIDNEFDEIDNLLREVDSLGIQGNPNAREHQEEQIAPCD